MAVEAGPLVPTSDDAQHRAYVRRFAWIGIAVVILALIPVFLAIGQEEFRTVGWLLAPGGFLIFRAIQALRHPERVARFQKRVKTDQLLGPVVPYIEEGLSEANRASRRLAVQDALDAIERQRGTLRGSAGGQIAAGIGTVGWLIGAIVSLVKHDLASAGICVIPAVGFGSLWLYLTRVSKRLKSSQVVLEEQLRSLEAHDDMPAGGRLSGPQTEPPDS